MAPHTDDAKKLQSENEKMVIVVSGKDLTLQKIRLVAHNGYKTALTDSADQLAKIHASSAYIQKACAEGQTIYGVTTCFGGMASCHVSKENAAELQNSLLHFLKCGTGPLLCKEDVRAAMLLRANSLAVGVSGVRQEIIDRIILFLNEGVTPYMHELGSIGASGDLVPLSYLANAISGNHQTCFVEYKGKRMNSRECLECLGLKPLALLPKEGLAIVNGTSVMTGIAANVTNKASRLFQLALAINALIFQALEAHTECLGAFIHQQKPHRGQIEVAACMHTLLDGSGFTIDKNGVQKTKDHLIQDRYSVRCLPQFYGPLLDELRAIAQDVQVEANSATDNPLIDADHNCVYHGGNFLGQYIGMGMDRLRKIFCMVAKHLDAQIAVLVTPEFSKGLPPSLIGNTHQTNNGMKGLQICGNDIMSRLCFFANPLSIHFPTHAEQFNQNINSLGFGSATLARQALELWQHYLSIALLFACHAVHLRALKRHRSCTMSALLSPASLPLYLTVRKILGKTTTDNMALVFDDTSQSIDHYLAQIFGDLNSQGDSKILSTLGMHLLE